MIMEQNNSFPFEIKDLEPDLNAELMKYWTGEHTGFVRVGPKGYFMPNKYRGEAPRIYNMEIRPSDIVVTSYPRSGTTWIQELVWMVANNLDYAKSETVHLTQKYTFPEFSVLIHPTLENEFIEENSDSEQKLKLLQEVIGSATKNIHLIPSPRFIKTHLPLSLLPPSMLDTAKVVYIARDPRDAAVSFYHLNIITRIHGYTGDFKTYWNYFSRGLHYWAPYFEHLKEAWQKRQHPNMLFLFYEELSKDLPAVVRRVSAFLNKQYTDEQIARLCEYLNFDNFKKNKSVNFEFGYELGIFDIKENTFVRKGKTGGWRDYFDDEMTQQAERWIADNLRDTDLRFPHIKNM